MRRLGINWHSALLFPTADPAWRRKILIGGLVLLLPVVGWPTVLGYRKEAVFRLIRQDRPILPVWRHNGMHFFLEGLKAVAVINAYYLPLFVWLAVRLHGQPVMDRIPWVGVLTFLALAPIFSTLVIPGILTAVRLLSAEPVFGDAEALAIAATFGLLTFLIPSGFLNVSRSGRMCSALDLPQALARVRRCFPAYLEAWIGSGLISLAGHLCVPLSPWGVVWCYLSIVYCFNDVPLAAQDRREAAYLEESWFRIFRDRKSWPAAAGEKGCEP